MSWYQAAAAGVQAAGSLVSGIAQAQKAKAEQHAAEQNSEIAQDEAAAQAQAIREKARRVRGSNIAAIGASGVTMDGSFADALTDSDINSELDAQTAIWNGELEAKNQKAQAKASGAASGASLFGGVANAGSQALSSYGSWKFLDAQKGAA
jgi:hypothetical protein